ncbi:hypothetical protein SNOG_11016 [Parastagonospora nodorum SN15]|uniref:Uncharacterized protein n=1 Tax=Phaeosphaeria nodorum (strain SN15 / ATCC MYA-4574 / FGSC 10173) TaxID=321614 RepID=Q0UB48_PHANO|nr:hypothetical protein SNOG_11016 [Parastagonospora nodorum SN15]EAT81515.2 hypothetical protein SNOG_11016 [Parastagonospora nodorum SN15]
MSKARLHTISPLPPLHRPRKNRLHTPIPAPLLSDPPHHNLLLHPIRLHYRRRRLGHFRRDIPLQAHPHILEPARERHMHGRRDALLLHKRDRHSTRLGDLDSPDSRRRTFEIAAPPEVGSDVIRYVRIDMVHARTQRRHHLRIAARHEATFRALRTGDGVGSAGVCEGGCKVVEGDDGAGAA